MYRSSANPYPAQHEEKPVLPSIGRLFDNAPARREVANPRQGGRVVLPPLSDNLRTRSETWPQHPPDSQGVNARQSHASYGYPPPALHEPYPDPRLSAQQTNHALDTLTSVRTYSQPEQASHDFGRDAHFSHSGSARVYENHRFDPVAYNPSRYPSSRDHDFMRHDSLRHHSSSPALYRAQAPMHEVSSSQSMSNARHQCSFCGKRFSRPSGLRIHITTHTGEKPYVCPEEGCRRSFSVRSNMRRHVRIVHHVEMPSGTSGTSPSSSGDDAADDRED